jgi:hypothetical protein
LSWVKIDDIEVFCLNRKLSNRLNTVVNRHKKLEIIII